MKKMIILFTLFTICALLNAYEWSVFGMDSGEINNICFLETGYFLEIICASNGFYTMETAGWVLHSYGGLPVWDLYADVTGTGDLILIQGNGSYSDGVYLYAIDISEYTVLHWFLYPKFLLKHEQSGDFYVGGSDGLIRSVNGLDWEEVPFFNQMNCHAIASYQNHIVVSANDYDIYYSNNNGTDWYQAESYLLITDMVFDSTGKLYGIFPDMSWSSGLWSSDDYGINWSVEFWDIMLNKVYTESNGNVFLGWQEPANNEGFAQWDLQLEELYFYNNGLPNININEITTHPFIDFDNIICCTDSGAYMLTNYNITNTDDELPEKLFDLTNYPNPFNPSTTISFTITEITEDTELRIFNLKGELIKEIPVILSLSKDNGQYYIIWDGTDHKGEQVSSGIFFCNLKTDLKNESRKMILLK